MVLLWKSFIWVLFAASATSLATRPAIGQVAKDLSVFEPLFAGSEVENYLRTLQNLGQVSSHPWSIRSFSPREKSRLGTLADSVHPWTGRFILAGEQGKAADLRVLPMSAQLTYNTAFPYGANDGPVWMGRGLTVQATGGASAHYGPLSIVLAPVAFSAYNREFPLAETGSGNDRFADPHNPRFIDLPQRFGDEVITRLDPGQSTVRLDYTGVAAGISTANQIWGPASDHALLLGTNAPGFPHAFAGTSVPVNVGLGMLHARVVWGRLEQSMYSPLAGDDRPRFFRGFVLTYVPPGVSGLEVGLGRAFHSLGELENEGWRAVLKPFEGLLKYKLPATGVGPDGVSNYDNQLAAVFFRWSFAPSGFELYAEYGREDHNWDLRDLLLEPDHQRAYMVGARQSWLLDSGHILTVRGEIVNAQTSPLEQVRPQGQFYRHTRVRQGHTHRGQLLGSTAAYTGGGSLVAAEYYHANGRWSVVWSRVLGDGATSTLPVEADIQHSLGLDLLILYGRVQLNAQLFGVYHFNRNFFRDQVNLNSALVVRVPLFSG